MSETARRRARAVVVAVAMAIASAVALLWWDYTVPRIGTAPYQAVFLANGQTYFGRYLDRLGPYAKLEAVYYIEQTRPGDDADAPVQSRLVRRGSEIHGPREPMYIPKTSVMFTEDLRSDSAIARFIAEDERR